MIRTSLSKFLSSSVHSSYQRQSTALSTRSSRISVVISPIGLTQERKQSPSCGSHFSRPRLHLTLKPETNNVIHTPLYSISMRHLFTAWRLRELLNASQRDRTCSPSFRSSVSTMRLLSLLLACLTTQIGLLTLLITDVSSNIACIGTDQTNH